MIRRSAILAVLLAVAACGGPSTQPSSPAGPGSDASPMPSMPGTITPSPADPSVPSASAATSCRLGQLPVTIPGGDITWFVDGVMSSGELLLTGSHVGFTGDTIAIMDPASGGLTVVVERTPPKSAATATSQVMGPIANADWVVWQESGFTLEASDWVMWAKDRHTGAIHKVASHELDASGEPLPGWASDITLLGNTAAWSAPAPSGAAAEQRIYVADLAAGSGKRLKPNARWPFLVGPGMLEAVVATGATSDDKVLSEPSSVSISDDHVASLGIMDPTRLLAFAASSAGSVTLRRLRDADDGTVVADAVTNVGGVTRSFPLPIDWGLAAAGEDFLAWSDQQHLWILPADSAEPIQLAEIAGEMGNLRFRAGGTRLYWHLDGQDTTPATDVLMTVTCP